MHQCPKCESQGIHRSRSKSPWERWRREITGKRIHRCRDCGWRGWGEDTGPAVSDAERAVAERALAPEPPNLARTALAREERTTGELRLKELDTFALADEPE